MSNRRQIFDSRQTFKVSAPATAGAIATLVGYPIVWNVISSDRGGYRVRLLPGSARFATPTLPLDSHDYSKVIGNTANGSLRIVSDSFGVKVSIDLPNTTTGRDLAELVGRRDVTGMSFSMTNGPERSTERLENGVKIIDVSQFTCDEVTVTATPAFVETSIATAAAGAGFARRLTHSSPYHQLQMLRFWRLPPA